MKIHDVKNTSKRCVFDQKTSCIGVKAPGQRYAAELYTWHAGACAAHPRLAPANVVTTPP